MSNSTTQILFNSPALHALKRDQLVKLCKIHSIKASGKNVELVEKLKAHAKSLPKEDPLNVAARSEDIEMNEAAASEPETSTSSALPRPSEQWEVVMDSIVEEEEPSQDTLRSRNGTKEFGYSTSKSSSTVGSSLKAFASSFGFKRSMAIPNGTTSTSSTSTLPAEEMDEETPAPFHQAETFTPAPEFNFNSLPDTSPLPGHALRPGAPAPVNARLSMGQAPMTPSKPTTTMRLVTKAAQRPSIVATPQLKPFHTSFDLDMDGPGTPFSSWPLGGTPKLYPSLPLDDGASSSAMEDSPTSPTRAQPFIFGSPDAKHNFSKAQFSNPAATSILDELNQRLKDQGVDSVSPDVIQNSREGREIKPLRKSNVNPASSGLVMQKFDKLHEQEFSKMEGIGAYVQRKAAAASSSSLAPARAGVKRKSNVLEDATPSSSRTPAQIIADNSKARRKIPGAFGDDDEEDEREERGGKRTKRDSAVALDHEAIVDQQRQREKEREAIKKQLDRNRAKRRSSAANGRPSINGRPRQSLGRKSIKPEPRSRFGFMNAAKSLVRNVWGGSSKSKTVAADKTTSRKVSDSKPPSTSIPKPPTLSGIPKPTPGSLHPTVKSTSGSLKPPSTKSSAGGSARSRSPLPSFDSGTGNGHSRQVSGSGSRGSSSKAFGSMTRSPGYVDLNDRGSMRGSMGSRLLAPTASSLAKTAAGTAKRQSIMAQKSTQERKEKPLETITNSTESNPFVATSPAAGKIFSQPPIAGPSSPSKIPVPSPVRRSSSQTTMQRSTSGRPRISRSKVIAKLASQRAAAGGSTIGPTSTVAEKRTSLNLKVKADRKSSGVARRSHVGTTSRESAVLQSAKKRARQSEYSRRRSGRTMPSMSMQVDGGD